MASANNPGEKIRKPVVAGSFYPGDARRLRSEIESYLNAAQIPGNLGKPIALVSPHAGYIYSGPVAAYGYKLLKPGMYKKVVVISPSHRVAFPGSSIYNGGGFETPLGVIPLAKDLGEQLLKRPGLNTRADAHAQEHALEVQLPFLQVALGSFELVPIVMGDQSLENCRALAKALEECLAGQEVLVVASSDLSHYHSYDAAVALDKIVAKHLAALDSEGLDRDLNSERCEACGGGPIITAMLYARAQGAQKGEVLKYMNSGDTAGDRSRVVGYVSAAFFSAGAASGAGGGASGVQAPKIGVDLGLSEAEKKILKDIARATIAHRLELGPAPEFKNLTPRLKEKRGAFVTLEEDGDLRGCIGYIKAIKPLYETIEEMAEAAAFRDPRFGPVQAAEFNKLQIEISVLTPFKKIDRIEEIEVGKHGIYIVKGFSSGLLLPQVATEHHWDRNTFLEQTCRKAGLPSDAWKAKGTEIYIFSADIF